jgi:hypothetical protein
MPGRSGTLLEQLSAKGSVRKAGDEFVVEADMEGASAREWNRTFLSALRKVEKRTTLRAEWTSDDGTSEKVFRLCPEEDNQELTRLCATTRLGSDGFQEPLLLRFGCPDGVLGRLGRFRGAGSLLYHHSDHVRKPSWRVTVVARRKEPASYSMRLAVPHPSGGIRWAR